MHTVEIIICRMITCFNFFKHAYTQFLKHWLFSTKLYKLKGIVHPKIKILSLITHSVSRTLAVYRGSKSSQIP